MSFDPQKFIDISKELQNRKTEAHYRTIISRAYYGVFGYIRESLPITTFDNMSVHREVIAYLKRSPNVEEQKIGSRLETLFKQRKNADYKYNIEIKSNTCEFVIKEAIELIKLFDDNQID